MVQEVGGVVVVVEVFVAPEMSLQDFAGFNANAVGGAFARGEICSRCDVSLCGLAVAKCGAQVVAGGARDRSFADEAGDPVGCQDSCFDLIAPASWLDWV